MDKAKSDRRVQRTKQLLFNALAELTAEKGYSAVTVQDITERANVGRSTFYAHFGGKDALFMNAHFAEFEPFVPEEIDIDALLAEQPSDSLIALFEEVHRTRAHYFELLKSAEMPHFQREVQTHFASRLESSLRKRFSDADVKIPLPVLANYLAGAQLHFLLWWVESHAPYSALEMAQSYQTMQRAMLRDALGRS